MDFQQEQPDFHCFRFQQEQPDSKCRSSRKSSSSSVSALATCIRLLFRTDTDDLTLVECAVGRGRW